MKSIQDLVLMAVANALIELGQSLKEIVLEQDKEYGKESLIKPIISDSKMRDLPAMLTVEEVGEILRIPRRRLYDELDEMGIPYKKLSPRRIRIPREGFLKWMEGNKEGA